jgi:hypothetical protein
MTVAKCIAGVKTNDVESANKRSRPERNQNPRVAQTSGKNLRQDFELDAHKHLQKHRCGFGMVEMAVSKTRSRH